MSKTRPIPFTTEMVRAILAGQKTQTRRVMGIQPLDIIPGVKGANNWVTLDTRDPEPHGSLIGCKYGIPGDRLWVKETWAKSPTGYIYKADFPFKDGFGADVVDLKTGKTIPLVWKSPRFMPRVASRILLEIVNVRAQRLQTIVEDDIEDEGIRQFWVKLDGDEEGCFEIGRIQTHDIREAFMVLWNHINGLRGHSWGMNPWVWAIEFKRISNG